MCLYMVIVGFDQEELGARDLMKDDIDKKLMNDCLMTPQLKK